ncbi:MAG TPA: AbrB/MazE/SpoVT family DNA-binding domain-containing protein, partial [Coriobacteriia bacterium]
MTTKGQVTIPAEVREALGFGTGDTLAFEVRGDYVVV